MILILRCIPQYRIMLFLSHFENVLPPWLTEWLAEAMIDKAFIALRSETVSWRNVCDSDDVGTDTSVSEQIAMFGGI